MNYLDLQREYYEDACTAGEWEIALKILLMAAFME
jgi:hypothetical protein